MADQSFNLPNTGMTKGLGDLIRVYCTLRNAYPTDEINLGMSEKIPPSPKDPKVQKKRRKVYHKNECLQFRVRPADNNPINLFVEMIGDNKTEVVRNIGEQKRTKYDVPHDNPEINKSLLLKEENIVSEIEVPEKYIFMSFEFSRRKDPNNRYDPNRLFSEEFENEIINFSHNLGYEVVTPKIEHNAMDLAKLMINSEMNFCVDSFNSTLLASIPKNRENSYVIYTESTNLREIRDMYAQYYINSGVNVATDVTVEKMCSIILEKISAKTL
jgi:hypothetical protein